MLKVHKYFIILQESFTSEHFLGGLLKCKTEPADIKYLNIN